MESVKQRSMPKGDDIGWEIVSIDCGVDDDGDLVTNPRADWVEDIAGWLASDTNDKKKGTSCAKANEVLRTLFELETRAKAAGSSLVFATKEIADLVGAPFERASMKPESLQKSVREALSALVAEGRVRRLGAQGYQTASNQSKSNSGSSEYNKLH